MTGVLEFLLWAGIFTVFYAYLGYGILLYLVIKVRRLFVQKMAPDVTYLPSVSLIVPCYNEGDFITEKLKNSFALDYPSALMELIFISDGSDDQTASILAATQGIIHLHAPGRAGKAAAMNRAVAVAGNDIVVFCDANTLLNKEAIRLMVRHYADASVGAVTGEKKIIESSAGGASSAGEGIYWKYESLLKKLDSELYSVVGAAGELMSYRRNLYETLEADTLLDDFMQSMRITLKGYRVVYEPGAVAMETASANVKEELKRKIRICAGGWQSMLRLPKAFNPFYNARLTFAFVSHRVLRWSLAPFFLPVILVANAVLAWQTGGMYTWLLFAQVAFYLLSLTGWYYERRNIRIKPLYIPYYFFIMNYSVFLGFARFVKGSQSALWERAKRA